VFKNNNIIININVLISVTPSQKTVAGALYDVSSNIIIA